MDLRDITEFLKDTFKYILVIVVVLLIAIFVFSFQQVVGPSMSGTLEENDVTIVNKLLYNFKSIERNDIVSVKVGDKVMVKRVIGLPGEYIEYKDNVLYINGEGFQEKEIKQTTDDFKISDLGYDKIPEGSYFVMGDNRGNSQDSRDYGPIKKEEIVGKVSLRIFPINGFKFF